MKDYINLPFHPRMEKIVDILRKKTQNEDPVFFRLMVSYHFSKMASMMRTNVQIAGTQKLPINMYAINLAPSGSGKGHSINILEDELMGNFRKKFLEHTFPHIAERNLNKLADRRAQRDSTDPDVEKIRAAAEFTELGELMFSFDSATSAAVKQMRTKLLMAGAGSMNLEIDEIGNNLSGNMEVFSDYLELFDVGKIKQKLTKNTRDNIRMEDLFGNTPANMLLFGTPNKLLDGAKVEDLFYELQETGYARRSFFGFCRYRKTRAGQTAKDIYNIYTDTATAKYLAHLNQYFAQLAEPIQFNQTLQMRKDVSMSLFEYRIRCQKLADQMSEYEELRKNEMAHRYFKVAKLAAVYAWIDRNAAVTDKHLEYAIAMAEESGRAFQKILSRDRSYAKLANYIASIGKELTHADLVEDLPFYKGTETQKREMMNLAIAHGYKNGIVIRRETVDGIEFLSGDMVQPTDMSKILINWSNHFTENYKTGYAPFSQLHNLTQANKVHWVTHRLRDGYRDEAHCIPGCNMIVLDVENSVSIPIAQLLLSDYTYLIHTTKRHTDKEHRFRILMPMSHFLELDAKDFKDFMNNIYDWLPFQVDRQTNQRSRKWLTHKGKYWYNEGDAIDALQFVPKTKKAEDWKAKTANQASLSDLEKWCLNDAKTEGRNNQLAKYAFNLVDMGHTEEEIQDMVLALNKKLDIPLDQAEITATIMVTVGRKLDEKDS
jgi:hypothetical protein